MVSRIKFKQIRLKSALPPIGVDRLLLSQIPQAQKQHSKTDRKYGWNDAGHDPDSVLDAPDFAFHFKSGFTHF